MGVIGWFFRRKNTPYGRISPKSGQNSCPTGRKNTPYEPKIQEIRPKKRDFGTFLAMHSLSKSLNFEEKQPYLAQNEHIFIKFSTFWAYFLQFMPYFCQIWQKMKAYTSLKIIKIWQKMSILGHIWHIFREFGPKMWEIRAYLLIIGTILPQIIDGVPTNYRWCVYYFQQKTDKNTPFLSKKREFSHFSHIF